MNAPPNIDEFGNLILLRQALDLLAAPENEQRAVYPADMDPAKEMASLFIDAWERVRPVFGPSLPTRADEALTAIESAFAAPRTDWAAIRPAADEARAALPGRASPDRRLPPYAEQIVRARNRLLKRQDV